MAEANHQTSAHESRRGTRLIVTYVAAALAGYGLGVAGLLPYGALQRSTSTPLARVGLALQSDAPPSAAAWASLPQDIASVRAGFAAPERDVFDLVVELRGLTNAGRPDLARAEQSCRRAGFPRCDEPALQILQKRSRP